MMFGCANVIPRPFQTTPLRFVVLPKYPRPDLRVVHTMRLTLVAHWEDATSLSVLKAVTCVADQNRQVLVPNVSAKAKHAA